MKLPGRCIECRTPLWWDGKAWRDAAGLLHRCAVPVWVNGNRRRVA
jgi:hypothetical protein